MNRNQLLPEPFYRGKVRDLYSVDDNSMLIVASDRISAFDLVFPETIPDKGKILNSISGLWLRALRNSGIEERYNFSDHLITADFTTFPEPFRNREELNGRTMHVRRCNRIDFEFVVRGYLVGSGWKDYQKTGSVCGHSLPTQLKLADRLPQTLFTPATKAPLGEHDENISFEKMAEEIGYDLALKLKNISIAIYDFAIQRLAPAGIILCDTKFEFGLYENEIVLIDEVLTPDSSRYWDKELYMPGKNQASYDKQIIRDYLESIAWNKKPPLPVLTGEIVKKTLERYREIENKIEAII